MENGQCILTFPREPSLLTRPMIVRRQLAIHTSSESGLDDSHVRYV